VSGLEVRQAGADDVDEIVAILSGAARWLLARGIDQWPDPFPRARVDALTRQGEFYVGVLGGRVVATLALLWSDPAFWGERPPDAGYVHALAVSRAWAGRGLGGELLAWAEEQVVREGREFLRLDCRVENEALRRYYESTGFEQRGEVSVDEFTSMRYERRCRSGPPSGSIVPMSAHPGHKHARNRPVRSQRERGRSTDPTQEGGGAVLG
jgi:ribosomal protein S18 acetylase RimI-like enzyme